MDSRVVRYIGPGGALLLAGVVVWVLTRGSYKSDIATICDAEAQSGAKVIEHQATVQRWIPSHLVTPEGNAWFKELSDKPLPERRDALASEAGRNGIKPCPLADGYGALASKNSYLGDLGDLCTVGTVAKLGALEHPERMERLSKWATTAKTEQAKALVAKLGQLPAEGRGAAMRAAATEQGLLHCDTADILDKPPAPIDANAPLQMVHAEVSGDMTERMALDTMRAGIEPLNGCYAAATAASMLVAGSLVLRLTVDAEGKVTSGRPVSGPKQDKELADCLVKAILTLHFPPSNVKVSSVTLHIQVRGPHPTTDAGLAPSPSISAPAPRGSAPPAPSAN
jgi:hypothetical protein